MKTVQLIGAISGNYGARKQFNDAAARLRKAGYEVVNPFELCAHVDEGLSINQYWWACMKLCIDSLQSGKINLCVIVNPVNHSMGADIELRCASKFKIPYCTGFATRYPITSAYSDWDYEEFERIVTALGVKKEDMQS